MQHMARMFRSLGTKPQLILKIMHKTITQLNNLIRSAKCGTDLTIARTMLQWSDVPQSIKVDFLTKIATKRKALG